jgi:hypothetical protein
LLDTKITKKELSRQVGKSRTYIAQKVRLPGKAYKDLQNSSIWQLLELRSAL